MALGASASHVRKRILASTMRLAAIGVVIGAVASILTARLISSLLYDTSPWDAVTYLGMALALLAVAALAGYIPALRASRIDPLVALRAE
jgi:ABC-type antimicrobial peptide transport system permease subunit